MEDEVRKSSDVVQSSDVNATVVLESSSSKTTITIASRIPITAPYFLTTVPFIDVE